MTKKKRVTTPLEILGNHPTKEQKVQAHAIMVTLSARFHKYGDPRTWEERTVMADVLDFTWQSGTGRMVMVAAYDEWLTGGWNYAPGVVKP